MAELLAAITLGAIILTLVLIMVKAYKIITAD